MQRLPHKLRVIVLLDIIIPHDMDERTRLLCFRAPAASLLKPSAVMPYRYSPALSPFFEN